MTTTEPPRREPGEEAPELQERYDPPPPIPGYPFPTRRIGDVTGTLTMRVVPADDVQPAQDDSESEDT